MAKMTHRTTFTLDELTAQRLKRLAKVWQVSQAEVVRRSVEQAERSDERTQGDPIALLRAYHAQGGLDRKKAEKMIAEIARDRKVWRGK